MSTFIQLKGLLEHKFVIQMEHISVVNDEGVSTITNRPCTRIISQGHIHYADVPYQDFLAILENAGFTIPGVLS
jgi:hypothetical protein